MDVSVIIPAYNEEKDIGKCLKSLSGQSFKKFEVIVVDDGSTDKTREIVSKFKKVKLVEGKHKGPGFSRNLGAKIAKGNILIFIDSDMAFDKDYIKNLIGPMLKNKNIIGTTHDYEVATNTSNIYSALWGKIRVSKEEAENVKIFRAIRRDNFLRLGGFDPKYGYADDQTLWFKYKIKPVVAPNTVCYHKNPETLKGTYKQADWIGASWKERLPIFKIPLISHSLVIPIFLSILPAALAKSLKNPAYSFNKKFRFYLYKFSGYSSGIFRAVYLGEVWK